MKIKPAIRWVIANKASGLYVGACLTRGAAIAEHCRDLGQTWDYCKRKGDIAIKCKVTPL